MNLVWNSYKRRKAFDKKAMDSHQSGSACRFIRLTRTSGLKLYDNKDNRDFAYKMQKRAHRKGLGPAVGDLVVISHPRHLRLMKKHCWLRPDGRDNKLYGYITQTVLIPSDGLTPEQLRKLTRSLQKAGFPTYDIGWNHNTGLLNDKPVCYDFEPLTMFNSD